MWKDICTLISKKPVLDESGNFYDENVTKDVFCNKKGIRQSEHYASMAMGMKPTLMLEVKIYDYDDEEMVEFNNVKYRINRIYPTNNENLELICEANHLSNNG